MKQKHDAIRRGDYFNEQEVHEAFIYFRNYKNQEVIHKASGEKHIVSDVKIHPFIWFDNGEEFIRGYDIRLYIKNRNIFIKSTAIQTFYPTKSLTK